MTRCTVLAGQWVGPYDGVTTSDPAAVDVDHVVSLKEAWDSGAWSWSASQLSAFANDLSDARTLRAAPPHRTSPRETRTPAIGFPRRCPVLLHRRLGRPEVALGHDSGRVRVEPYRLDSVYDQPHIRGGAILSSDERVHHTHDSILENEARLAALHNGPNRATEIPGQAEHATPSSPKLLVPWRGNAG